MKKMSWNKLNNERGGMLLLSFLLIFVLLALGSAAIKLTVNELNTAERQFISAKAFHIAEAGIEKALYELKQDFVNDPTPSWQDDDINGTTYDLSSNYTTFLTSTFSTGSYVVSLKEGDSSEHAWVQSVGTEGDVAYTLRAYVKLVDISPWDNAIFAGAGASGTMVNGNVDVRGSVHILGTGLADGDLAIDLGGTAEFVGNNYAGLDAGLAAKIPALPTVLHNGETVSTLQAELRVKNGSVGLSGSSTVGQANVAGNSVKETVDNVFVTDGWAGNQGSASVYSDNGTTNAYDLGDVVVFPSLSDPDPDDPSKTRQQYFKDNALVLTTELQNITPGSSFSYGDATNNISMDGSGNLTINGRVYIADGNTVSFNKQGSNKTITYSGKGSLLSEGKVQINTDLITSGSNSFPSNILGVMTPDNIGFNAASIDVMGVFYAENLITVQKQTDIIGTLVSNYFNVGTNVPAVYQVPGTSSNLPPGMIGQGALWYMVVLWQKI